MARREKKGTKKGEEKKSKGQSSGSRKESWSRYFSVGGDFRHTERQERRAAKREARLARLREKRVAGLIRPKAVETGPAYNPEQDAIEIVMAMVQRTLERNKAEFEEYLASDEAAGRALYGAKSVLS